MLLGLAVVAMAVTVGVAEAVFPHGTTDLDEVSYQTQANVLRDGHLDLNASRQDPSFRPFLSGVRGDSVVFKYQPLWPALIAASDSLFGSSLPLRALCAAAGILAVAWLGWELTKERRVALLAAALALASPFTWVQSASLLSYQLSLVLGTAAAAALLHAARVRRTGAGLLAGLLVGLAVLHRPFDALLAVLPVLVFVAWDTRRQRGRFRMLAPVAIGFAPCAGAFLAYNAAVAGSVLRLAFVSTGSSDRFLFGWRASFVLPGTGHSGQIDYTVARAWSTLLHDAALMPRFIAFAPLVLLCAGAAVVARRRDPRTWLLVAMIATVAGGYFFWWATANAAHFGIDRSLGPFYDYAVLPPICVLAARGATSIRLRARTIAAVAAVAIVWSGVASTVVLADAWHQGRVRSAEVDETELASSRPTLVLDPPAFPGDPYLRFATDAKLTARHLVGLDVPSQRLEVVNRFPNRQIYLVRTYHRFGDPFGPMIRDRVRLVLLRGSSVTIGIHAEEVDARAGTAYLRIGNEPPMMASSGHGPLTAAWDITPAMLDGDQAVVLAVGVTLAPFGAPAPTTMTQEWYECLSYAAGGGRPHRDPVTVRRVHPLPVPERAGRAVPRGRVALVAGAAQSGSRRPTRADSLMMCSTHQAGAAFISVPRSQ